MKTRIFLMVTDGLMLSGAFFLAAQWFGLLSAEPRWEWYFAVLLGTKAILFAWSGLYRSILRFAGMPLAGTILKTTTLASAVCYGVFNLPTPHDTPLGFFVTDYLLTTFFVGLARFAPRYWWEHWQAVGSKRVLIYGAGVLGEEVARKLMRNSEEYRVVGFLDDEASKIGKTLHNVPIYGSAAQLSAMLAKLHVAELILAIGALEGAAVRAIARECRRQKVVCRIVPSFSDLLRQDIDIKNLDVADLLRREPKDLDKAQIQNFLKGQTVCITGAGGSIGSELSRHCLQYGVRRLVCIDHSEYHLYRLEEDLGACAAPTRFCLMNLLDRGALERLIATERPAIVFHAAAYKHVPILEASAAAGIINNVRGTMHVAEIAEKYRVKKCVLISTDKAVRPTSVMGASKRIAELYIQNFNASSATQFVSVRFGNVLASSGSVIPKFIEQINRGGPVTVTHPEATRYFMLTAEAVALVLQAASIGNGGEIFVLNMGQPVRIAEMAEELIFLAGREPHTDIPIEFIGLRPGEKLHEELFHDEMEKKTRYENITIGRARYVDWDWLTEQIDALLTTAERRDDGALIERIKAIVPEFVHDTVAPAAAPPVLVPLATRVGRAAVSPRDAL